MKVPFVFAALIVLLKSCQPVVAPPPVVPPINPAVYAKDCETIYQQELGRAPDLPGLIGCEAQMVQAKQAGAPLPQEVFRAWVRTQPEWAQHQESLKVVTLPQLRVRGQFFEQENGQRFTLIEASDFLLYQRFLNGEDIRSVLKQRSDAGFNTLRVFGMVNGSLGRFLPFDYGDRYYSGLDGLSQLVARFGFYIEFTAFADATQAMPDRDQQVAHWQRIVDTVRPLTNVVLEIGNELDQPINQLISVAVLPQPKGVLASHGSNGSQAIPVMPYWDYLTFHTNGAPEHQRKVGHNCMELDSRPCSANENTRAPDQLTSTAQAFDAAAGAALLAAGSTFHSVNGRSSTLWNETELVLAKAWVAGATSVPLSCQDGAYRHRDDLETPALLRVYQRGSDPTCIVRIRR